MYSFSLFAVACVCWVHLASALVQISSIDQIRTLFKDGALLPGNEDIVLTTHLDLSARTAPSLVTRKGKNAVTSIRARTSQTSRVFKLCLWNPLLDHHSTEPCHYIRSDDVTG
jgi:hypothetical protein